jgi:uncharacterized membrane protein
VIVPHFAPGGGSPFEGRYAEVGGSPGGIARTAVEHPLRVLQAADEHRDLAYVWHLLAPLLGLPLLSPLLAASALPELGLNLLSSTQTQTSIHFHYTAGAIPGLVAAAVLGAARLQRRRPRIGPVLCRGAVLVALAAGIALGPLPAWRHVPFGPKLATRDHVVTTHARAATRMLETIPADVPVSATNTLGAHLSGRRRIFSFPVLREARWVAVDTKQPSYLDDALGRRFPAAYAKLRRDPRWRVVAAEDGVVVLTRSP